LAVIGCGAIAETGHLPGAQLVPGLEVTLLIDKDQSRAARMGQLFGVVNTSTDVRDVEQQADAAIICLPHHLHCPVAIDLMERGVHVLVEKPMALTKLECDRMLEVAKLHQVVLAVGLMRRFFRSAIFLKEILRSNLLGNIQRFKIEDGGVYSWASASPFVLSKEHSGGGVLMGNGTHVMDSLVWWFGDPVKVRCRTNSMGGMETDALVEVTMPDESQGTVELSRTRSLGNFAQIWAEKGSVRIPLYGDNVRFSLNGGGMHLEGAAVTKWNREPQTLPSVLADQLREFLAAIGGHESNIATGVESRRSIDLIERCYQVAEPLVESWSAPFKWV
jgi:predicted dehydrogenase